LVYFLSGAPITRINIELTILEKDIEETLSLQNRPGHLELRAF